MTRKQCIHLWGVILGLGFGSMAMAQVPGVFHFSGQLDSSGGDFTGTTAMQVALYDDPTLGGETHELWAEMQTVTVSQGRFHVLLGTNEINPILPSYFQKPAVYVGITVGNDSEMTPRIRVASTPYATLAGDAATLGGVGASSYVTQAQLDNAGFSTGAHTVNTDVLDSLNCKKDDTIQWNGNDWGCVAPPTGGGGGASAFAMLTLESKQLTAVLGTYGIWHEVGNHVLTGVSPNTLILLDLSMQAVIQFKDIINGVSGQPFAQVRLLINGTVLQVLSVTHLTLMEYEWAVQPFSMHAGQVTSSGGTVTITVEVSKGTDDHQFTFQSGFLRVVAMPMQ